MKETSALVQVVVIVLGVALGSTGASAQDPAFQWTGKLDGGKAITVSGISGDVRATRSSSDRVEVVAHTRGPRSDQQDITFEVVEHANGVTICSIYPTRREETQCQSDGVDLGDIRRGFEGRVEWDVRIPDGVDFNGLTISGDISARGLTGNVEARSVSGDIDVTTTGIARARTVSGSIDVVMENSTWRGELEFSTVSGDVRIGLPGQLDTDVELRSVTGDLESDFPISMTRSRIGFVNRTLRGTIGAGGRDLVLRTVSGDVTLRRR